MEETKPLDRMAAPAWFWIISLVSLAWNSFGAYDYTMTQIRDPGYLAMFPPETIDWIDTFPAWVVVAWAVGVWASVLGSILLLARSRRAILAFEASFAGAILSNGYQFLDGDMPAAARTPSMLTMTLVIFAAIVLQWWYAKRQTGRGVLR